MSTELAIANERGQSMAELMGVSSAPSQEYTPSISRLGMLNRGADAHVASFAAQGPEQ